MSWTHIVMGLTGCIQSLFIETLIDLLQCEKKNQHATHHLFSWFIGEKMQDKQIYIDR